MIPFIIIAIVFVIGIPILMCDKIARNICPRCGGKLVLRYGKYGQFYGCENYPNCKFVKK